MKRLCFWCITLALSFVIANIFEYIVGGANTFLYPFTTMTELFAWGSPIGCVLYNWSTNGLEIHGDDYFLSIGSSILGIVILYFLFLYFSFFMIIMLIFFLILIL